MKHIRFAITIATLVFSACASAAEAVKVTPPQPQQKVLSSSNGRYVFGQISEYRRDQYMLDTQTGRLWQIVTRKGTNPDGSEASGEGFLILEPVAYSDINGKLDLVPR